MTSNSFNLMPFEDQMAAMQQLAVELYKLHNLTGIAHMRISHKRSVRVIEMDPREVPTVQLADYSSAVTLDSNMHAHIDRWVTHWTAQYCPLTLLVMTGYRDLRCANNACSMCMVSIIHLSVPPNTFHVSSEWADDK